jgi:hypothetical protein
MIWTTPWRRITLHFSHIGLTDGLTFIVPSGSTDLLAQRLPACPAFDASRSCARSQPTRRRERDREW